MKHEKIDKFHIIVSYSISKNTYMDMLLVYEMILVIVYYQALFYESD